MPTTADVAKMIEDRRAEVKAELAKLDAASSALHNGGTRPRGRPRRNQGTSSNAAGTLLEITGTGIPPGTVGAVGRAQARASSGSSLDLTPQPKPKRTQRTRKSGRVTRKDQAAALLREKPRTIPELAEAMKIEPNYLYRVLPKVPGAKQNDDKVWSIED